ncbi:predicted protein [Nematostella vectensis]|uniref:DZIP3-like HEPN domain-containing protein n=1 Tax=Nematostella vectensis TaxID=45351 RepID=A7S647_NEMVE|nr:predicted protein [Nematostella vectensis]|eukprot:XP_001632858.1 predicted protein [Nematostella vectensis]
MASDSHRENFLRLVQLLIEGVRLQWPLLYPPSGNPDCKLFDITLLTMLLRNICGILTPTPTDPFWSTYPPDTDYSDKANLVRIRMLRNEFGHRTTIVIIDDSDLMRPVGIRSQIFSQMVSLGEDKAEIDDTKTRPKGTKDYHGTLQRWIHCDLQELKMGSEKVQKMDRKMNKDADEGVSQKVEEMTGKMSELSSTTEKATGDIQQHISELSAKVTRKSDSNTEKTVSYVSEVKTELKENTEKIVSEVKGDLKESTIKILSAIASQQVESPSWKIDSKDMATITEEDKVAFVKYPSSFVMMGTLCWVSCFSLQVIQDFIKYLHQRYTTGYRMLICGFYNPPKHDYRDEDLMSYLISFVDSVLDKHPDTVVVCGGDLNRLDLQELKALSGWDVLVDFPTRGDAILDNCLTNRPILFGKAYPVHMLIKTDHNGFALPAGRKLKPIRRKVQVHDCREHRKQALYMEFAETDWGDVTKATNVNVAVGGLEQRIRTLMDKHMPLRSVQMSTQDPAWMMPLVKSLFWAKSRIAPTPNNEKRLKVINHRISEIISQNRKNPSDILGSRDLWASVDSKSQRRVSNSTVALDKTSLDGLNEYFGRLCRDNYTKPVDLEIAEDVEVPVISERLVWRTLENLKKTATGPFEIPHWIWRDFSEIFVQVIHKIWNLSIYTGMAPVMEESEHKPSTEDGHP